MDFKNSMVDSSLDMVEFFITQLNLRFALNELGIMYYFLGVRVTMVNVVFIFPKACMFLIFWRGLVDIKLSLFPCILVKF